MSSGTQAIGAYMIFPRGSPSSVNFVDFRQEIERAREVIYGLCLVPT